MIFFAATLLFLANFVLGVLVHFGVVDTKAFRWLHHALFFAVFASAALAVGVGFLRDAPYPLGAPARPLRRFAAGARGYAGTRGRGERGFDPLRDRVRMDALGG